MIVALEPDSSLNHQLSTSASHRFFADLFSANAHRMFNREHEHLPVADLAGLGGSHNDIDRLVNQVVRHHYFHFHLRQKIHRVFASPVNFGVPFLPAKTFDLSDGHPFDAELCERFLNLFELERLNDGFQFFHVSNFGTARSFQSKANRSTRSHSNGTA